MSDKPRAYTPEEVRKQFIDHLHVLAGHWAQANGQTEMEKLEGLAFSILNIFDGSSMAFPGMDIVLRPHSDDKNFCKNEGRNWYKDGQVINDCVMHEEFYPKRRCV